MRSFNHLYPEIISFQNLLKASKLAQRGKRLKDAIAKFNFHLERMLWQLHGELATKRYQPGNYYHFVIYEPKRRVISAAPYRDRVVHHALHNVLEPLFDPTFIFDSYATRKEKGTHAAIDRCQYFAQQTRYALKCDIQKYFPSIHHSVLMQCLQRKVACSETLWLIEKILSSHSGVMADELHPSIHPSIHPVGIPIGNLTSQFFANIYLNGLDHFIKQNLRCRHYLRYMDDFVLFHDDKEFLWFAKDAIIKELEKLRLRLHEGKCRIFATKQGLPFLGMVVFPHRRRLKQQNVLRFKQRLKRFQKLYSKDSSTWLHIHQSIQSWIGYASHADTRQLRKNILEEVGFQQQKGS